MRVRFVVWAIYLFSPFYSPFLNCVFDSVVSHVFVVIPIDRRSVAYLASFMDAASRIGSIELWQVMFGVYITFLELVFFKRRALGH
jgi:hypothetical protein